MRVSFIGGGVMAEAMLAGILDASLTYATTDDKWLVSLGASNLTDKIYSISESKISTS